MAIQSSGAISITDIVNEFGGTAPHSMSEYYRNGGEVPGNNTNVPTSGTISLSNFYGAVNEIIHNFSNNDTNQNLATVFGSNWSSSVPKRAVVGSGVTVGGTNTHAIMVPSGMGGSLNIDVSGSVLGHGGTANSGGGGPAIYCQQTSGVTITLNSGGNIKGGGGGGGQGGPGGTGGNGGTGGTGGTGATVAGAFPIEHVSSGVSCSFLSYFCNNSWYWGQWGQSGNYPNRTSPPYINCSFSYTYSGPTTSGTCSYNVFYPGGNGGPGGSSGGGGGAGGAGGRGQGYNHGNQGGSGGSAGSPGGGGSPGSTANNAGTGGAGGARGQGGTGGTGGAGGTYGNQGGTGLTGNTGNTGITGSPGNNGSYSNGSPGSPGSSGSPGSGGSPGGPAGYYIYNRASITFNNNGGTVAGR